MRTEIYRFKNEYVEFTLYEDHTWSADIFDYENLPPEIGRRQWPLTGKWRLVGTENILIIAGISLLGGFCVDDVINHSENIRNIILEREFLQ